VSAEEIAFTIVAVVGSLAAIRLVTSQNVVHAALYLVVTLAMVGAVYLIVAAEFLAWVQVLIYVGAVVVLVLFSLMLTRAPIGRETLDNRLRWLAAVFALALFAGLALLIQGQWGGHRVALQPTTTEQVGTTIFRSFVLPFEVVSVLLLAALVGAVVLARKEDAPPSSPQRQTPRPPARTRPQEPVSR
jgi:NADH-quinone oxidoreductase subunit J